MEIMYQINEAENIKLFIYFIIFFVGMPYLQCQSNTTESNLQCLKVRVRFCSNKKMILKYAYVNVKW